MTGIGISLDDLGIEMEPFTPHETQDDEGYPREYDFTLDLHIHGSWRQMRDALYPVAEAAFRGRETPLLGFTLHWAEREDGDTEESIKAALTGLKYDEQVHHAFEDNLGSWAESATDPSVIRQAMAAESGTGHESFLLGLAENEHRPQDVLQQLLQEPAARQALTSNTATPAPMLQRIIREDSLEDAVLMLRNPVLPEDLVRELFDLAKEANADVTVFADAVSRIPSDVLEQIAKMDNSERTDGSRAFNVVALRPEVTEEALINLFGKCDPERILRSHAYTAKVRDVYKQLCPSGAALAPFDRQYATEELKKIRIAIMTGLTECIKRRGRPELSLLEAVLAKPELDVHDAHCILLANTEDDF